MPTETDSAELVSTSDFPAFMRPAELAERLHLSPKTLAGWRQSGVGPAYIAASARAVIYPANFVVTWMAARKRRSTSGAMTAA